MRCLTDRSLRCAALKINLVRYLCISPVVLIVAVGCETRAPNGAVPEDASSSHVGSEQSPARIVLNDPPPLVLPAGMSPNDFAAPLGSENWSLSPRRTAATRNHITDIIIRDFKSGKTLCLAAGYYPSWSPDENWILFWSRGWCLVRRDGQVHFRVTYSEARTPADEELPAWRPGRAEVLLREDTNVVLVSAEAGRKRLITTSEVLPRARFYWSPDGELIFYRYGFGRYGPVPGSIQ